MTTGGSGHVFTTWGKTHSCKPEVYFEPTCEDDLKQILAVAREKRKTVKVVGCGHSFNDIACTDGFMLSLKRMNRVIEIDKVNSTVKVEAGILISELSDILAQNDLALSVFGMIDSMTLGAVVCTGYHGSGIAFGSVEDYVMELSIMLADGDLMTLSCNDADDEIFQAARLSLGALGIIVSLKLQCEPAFNLQQITYLSTLDDVINNVDSHLASSDHFQFAWFPLTDGCAVLDTNRTTKPASHVDSSWFWDTFLGCIWLMEFLFWFSSTFVPFLVPWVINLFCKLLVRPGTKVDRSDRVFVSPCVIRNVCAEWCVPRAKFVSVMSDLRRLAEGRQYLYFPVDIRFVKRSSKCLLSPQSDADAVHLNFAAWLPYGQSISYDRLFAAVQSVKLKFGGKPHWGKKHDLTYSQLSSLYNTQLQRFVDVRNKLDPQRIFTNDYLRRVLGD